MAWFAAALPYVAAGLSAAGTIRAGRQDAKTLKLQSIAANQQAQADEEAQRRENRQFLGKQAGAIAEAGLGYGGSAGMLAAQSETLAELDALNTRYNGRLRGAGLMSESRATGKRANALAGQQFLNSVGSNYSGGGFGLSLTKSAQSKREGWLAGAGRAVKADPMRGAA